MMCSHVFSELYHSEITHKLLIDTMRGNRKDFIVYSIRYFFETKRIFKQTMNGIKTHVSTTGVEENPAKRTL